MARNGGGSVRPQARLLVAKGSFSVMGGGERDIIRNLPALSKKFKVTVATLDSSNELDSLCEEYGLDLMKPDVRWTPPKGPISRILDRGFSSSLESWKSIGGLVEILGDLDYLHLTSGDGSLSILEIIPDRISVHLHLLEPHRGLHEDVLHRMVDGSPRRNLSLTRVALSMARRKDLSKIRRVSSRDRTAISGNSEFTSSRIEDVYGISSGVLPPSLDPEEFPSSRVEDESSALFEIDSPYAVTIGRASWAKGTWEAISMLRGTGFSLALVGGGEDESIDSLIEHAKSCQVGLWVAPRLESSDLCSLVKGAVAVISMAHSEPFGLTPIEAQSLGTPALFVDEGGFRETISDGVSGRLLPRDDYSAWHEALAEAGEADNRSSWSKNGRANIANMGLNPEVFSKRLEEIFLSLE